MKKFLKTTENNKKEKWIIDTDPGCDDMMCLLYMLNRTDIDIRLISLVEGNTTFHNVLVNMRKIIKITQRTDVPLYKGCSTILNGCPPAVFAHMVDGLGDIPELINLSINEIHISEGNSSLKIIEQILAHPHEINLLFIGPLTNLACAFLICPEIANLVKNVYIMGGSIYSRGNILPGTEFNFAYDIIAPKIVLSNFKKIIIMPWEPIETQSIDANEMRAIKENHLNKIQSYKELSYYYAEKMVDKFTQLCGGMKMCDFYCSTAILNHKVVKNCFLSKLESIIDTDLLRGVSLVKHKEKVSNYEQAYNELIRRDEAGLCIIIEKIDKEILLEELLKIFAPDNIISF